MATEPMRPFAVASTAAPETGRVGPLLKVQGTIVGNADMQIDGEVEGTINSEGRLVVEKNARIRGEIRAGSVTVFGTVDGNVTATERCELRAGCTLRGDIEAPRLVVDDDATFIGSARITKRP